MKSKLTKLLTLVLTLTFILACFAGCGNTEENEGGKETTCATCHGTGQVVTQQRTFFGNMQSRSVCPDCNFLRSRIMLIMFRIFFV